MQTQVFFKNRIKRQISWNGQEFIFRRYAKNEYQEIDYSRLEEEFVFRGIFHDGGGYGGMLNITLYERDGARTITKMKPMILALYEDAKGLKMDDVVQISNNTYKVVEKNDVKGMGIAFEISLEIEDFKEQ